MKLAIDKNVSVLITVLTAVTITALIRLSSYILPERFYFTVSSVFKADETAMLVQHPGLAGPRFCELASRYGVTAEDMDLNSFECDKTLADNEDDPSRFTPESLRMTEAKREELVERIVEKRAELNAAIDARFDPDLFLTQLATEFERSSLPAKPHETFFIREFQNHIAGTVRRVADTYIRSAVGDVFAAEIDDINRQVRSAYDQQDATAQEDNNADPNRLSEAQSSIVYFRTETAVLSRLKNTLASDPFQPPLTEIADGFKDMDSIESTQYRLQDILGKKIEDDTRAAVDEALAEFGFESRRDERLLKLERAFVAENLPTYVASALIRIGIVMLGVFLVAFVALGKADTGTFGVGAAFAALLLTWPIISLWETVVSSEWQSMRPVFLGIYFLYILAFYFSGKFAAGLASKLRRWLATSEGVPAFLRSVAAADDTIHISGRELATNLTFAAITNGLAYTLNLSVPVSG